MPKVVWTPEAIKQGIDRYINETGHPPTAHDFDSSSYLPSARHIQRAYGGLERLRRKLGYEELNYAKGDLRRSRSLTGHTEGTAAEDRLEAILIKRFGEAFVHTQKRYYIEHKNRYDFFVYYHGGYFAVDIFTTTRPDYIGNNIRHKLPKYKNVPSDTQIFFVVAGERITANDVRSRTASIHGLSSMPNVKPILLSEFAAYIATLEPLATPMGLKTVLKNIEQM